MKEVHFGIGQIEGVREYVEEQLPHMAKRLGLNDGEKANMTRLFLAALVAARGLAHNSIIRT